MYLNWARPRVQDMREITEYLYFINILSKLMPELMSPISVRFWSNLFPKGC